MISKENYILKSLKKIRHKKWELFIISRLIHKLDDDEIEFVTQQLIIKEDGSRYLTDIFFPQFRLHLEIDEEHHLNQKEADERRQQDIIDITGHNIIRIPSTEVKIDLNLARNEVDKIVREIKVLKMKKIEQSSFISWNWEKKYLAESKIEKGYLSIQDNDVFQKQVEALRCFGFKGEVLQRGAWKIPDGTNDIVWFPRLYSYNMWKNELTNHGTTILERATDDNELLREKALQSLQQQREHNSKFPDRKYIVFAKAKDILGFNLLRYVGTFKMNMTDTNETYLRFDRISTKESIRRLDK